MPCRGSANLLRTAHPLDLDGRPLPEVSQGTHFPAFLAASQPLVGEIAEMRHYAATGVEWSRD